MKSKSIAIVGTVGVPANYGGFETLAENLVKFHHVSKQNYSLTVYCSSKSYTSLQSSYLSAKLKFVPLNANGAQSILYDVWSLFSAVRNHCDVILLLGVSGAIALPFLRLFSSVRIITNIDGIEWRREKWRGFVRFFLRFSEKLAVRYSHDVVADNAAIAAYVRVAYGLDCHVIAYGGDHAVNVVPKPVKKYGLPDRYAFSVCRIEPENNIDMVLEAFAQNSSLALVIVGNWVNSEYGSLLRELYAGVSHLYLLDPIYDLGELKSLRSGAVLYVHGHSAGGTNPSLVEAMHFGLPVLAFNCDFNRETTEEKAFYFCDSDVLARMVNGMRDEQSLLKIGEAMLEVAQRRYTWEAVARQYFSLISS